MKIIRNIVSSQYVNIIICITTKATCQVPYMMMTMMMMIIIIILCYCKYFPPFSEEDEEVFEDNPEEYIRRDIEGSG